MTSERLPMACTCATTRPKRRSEAGTARSRSRKKNAAWPQPRSTAQRAGAQARRARFISAAARPKSTRDRRAPGSGTSPGRRVRRARTGASRGRSRPSARPACPARRCARRVAIRTTWSLIAMHSGTSCETTSEVAPVTSLSVRISLAATPIEIRSRPGEGLVVHDQFGVERDGARQRDAPRHAARDLADAQPGARRAGPPH